MKKVLSFVLVLALVFAQTATAMAAGVGLGSDVEVVQPGDTVTVAVTLSEAVSVEAGTTAVQGNLSYDKNKLTYVGASAGAGYGYLTVANNNGKSRVNFYYLSMTDPQVPVALPAGTVIQVTFRANDVTTVTAADFSVTFGAADCYGNDTLPRASAATSVTICPNHSYEMTDSTPGTCLNPGTATYACACCGHTYTESVAGDHAYVPVITAPTCTAQGYTTYTCSVCGDSYVTDYVDELGHSYGAWYTDIAPTCTAEGQERRNCENCDGYETRAIAATGHTYTAAVTAPTCTEQGYTTYTCHCGDSYVADYVDALGHTHGEGVRENEAEDGTYDLVFYCEACGEEVSRERMYPGDLDGNGESDIFDANLIVAFYNGTTELRVELVFSADLNGDGEVDIFDANLVVAFYNGTIDAFPN